MFLMWFDDDRKKTVSEKIAEALAAYEHRFNAHPNVVLVHANEVGDAPKPVRVCSQPFIQPSHFYVGIEDAA
jgi:hypothetical protein